MPLESYTAENLERQFEVDKPCALYCTVGCVHRVAVLDRFRERLLETIIEMLSPDGAAGPLDDVPRAVRILAWLFVTGRFAGFFKKGASKLLGLRGQTAAYHRFQANAAAPHRTRSPQIGAPDQK